MRNAMNNEVIVYNYNHEMASRTRRRSIYQFYIYKLIVSRILMAFHEFNSHEYQKIAHNIYVYSIRMSMR